MMMISVQACLSCVSRLNINRAGKFRAIEYVAKALKELMCNQLNMHQQFWSLWKWSPRIEENGAELQSCFKKVRLPGLLGMENLELDEAAANVEVPKKKRKRTAGASARVSGLTGQGKQSMARKSSRAVSSAVNYDEDKDGDFDLE